MDLVSTSYLKPTYDNHTKSTLKIKILKKISSKPLAHNKHIKKRVGCRGFDYNILTRTLITQFLYTMILQFSRVILFNRRRDMRPFRKYENINVYSLKSRIIYRQKGSRLRQKVKKFCLIRCNISIIFIWM